MGTSHLKSAWHFKRAYGYCNDFAVGLCVKSPEIDHGLCGKNDFYILIYHLFSLNLSFLNLALGEQPLKGLDFEKRETKIFKSQRILKCHLPFQRFLEDSLLNFIHSVSICDSRTVLSYISIRHSAILESQKQWKTNWLGESSMRIIGGSW